MNGYDINLPGSTRDEWLTPKYILEELGEFDLDPCASEKRLFNIAKNHFVEKEDGLNKEWIGCIYINPPYSKVEKWVKKLAIHNNGIALIYSRTDTIMFQEDVFNKATSILFLKGRIKFIDNQTLLPAKTGAGCGSVLIAYGEECDKRIKNCNLIGKYIKL